MLVIGGGARNHAIAEALRRSPSVAEVVLAPGTSGLERRGYPTAPVATQDLPGLVEHALLEGYDLSVVGPNTPLVDGIVDRFEAEGLPIFGPTRAAARLEGSKSFARLLMSRLGIPTPRFAICDDAHRAMHMARTQRWARVFKVDGIAYERGVRVTHELAEAEQALQDILVDNIYGLESERIVVEERIDGVEFTLFALTDGEHVEPMGHVLNHPRLCVGDTGPPSRGMGQVAPAPPLDEAMYRSLVDRVLIPTVRAMAEADTPLRGALFVDLMLCRGEPYAIDYNVRFGDPATQTLLHAWSGDLYRALQACRGQGDLASAVAAMHHDPRPRVSVVVVCEGYPHRRVRGAPIALDESVFDADPDLALYEDGVRVLDGDLLTTGGRTFTVVAAGDTVAEARARAYRGIAA
ncbi:MAG: phosphoribosylamine--glycine ligase, partial [Deltaproteobacteria bacterium]|nr:phosphoribosylamine--glycine ligase [Deltaproteobacteria bacterium]